LFVPAGQHASWLADRVEYQMPWGWLGKTFGGWYACQGPRRMFGWRHKVSAQAVPEEISATVKSGGAV